MAMNRYQQQIRQIIHAQDRHASISELRWYDYAFLPQTVSIYLKAKATRVKLSLLEQRFLNSAKVEDATDDNIDLELAYFDPDWSHTQRLVELDTLDEKNMLESTDFDHSFQAYSAMADSIRHLGETITPADFDYFSMTPHTGWASVPSNFLEYLLTGYTKHTMLNPHDLQQIFDQRLVQAYWPITTGFSAEHQVTIFFNYLDTEGFWLLNLIGLLNAQSDPDIRQLVNLWLRWFKHEKTFHGYETQAGAQQEIRHAKAIINLLNHDEFNAAGQQMIRHVAEFWD